eukprot:4939101-Karenia_brevis.AAC.1
MSSIDDLCLLDAIRAVRSFWDSGSVVQNIISGMSSSLDDETAELVQSAIVAATAKGMGVQKA